MKTQALHLTCDQGMIYAKAWTPANLGDKCPIVLFHDSLGSVELWRDFPEQLANVTHRQVIAYDRLGYGQSTAKTLEQSLTFIHDEADFAFPKLKQQLELSTFIALGHSVGGCMALNVAAQDAQCQAVITLAATVFVEQRTLAGIRAAQRLFQQEKEMQRLRKYHGEKADWVLNAWTSVWLSEAFAQWTLRDCLNELTCAGLAIHGQQDEYGSLAFPQFIVEHANNETTTLLLEDCGHFPHKEQSEKVLKAIAQFLTTAL